MAFISAGQRNPFSHPHLEVVQRLREILWYKKVRRLVVRRTLDRYVLRELGPLFVIGLGLVTLLLIIDRIYDLTDLVMTRPQGQGARREP